MVWKGQGTPRAESIRPIMNSVPNIFLGKPGDKENRGQREEFFGLQANDTKGELAHRSLRPVT